LADARRQQLVGDDAVDHGSDFALSESIEREGSHMRTPDPRRLEFRPERHDQQRTKCAYSVYDPPKYFEARRIGPMRILEDHQHRIGARQGLHLRNERLQRTLPALLRGQIECGITSIIRQRQQVGEERGVSARGRTRREHGIQLVEPRSRGVVAPQSGGAFQLTNNRMQRAVHFLRGAEIAKPRMRLGGEALHQCGRQPRLADASLAGDEDDLAFPCLRLDPTP
jgi:hypothetical protein